MRSSKIVVVRDERFLKNIKCSLLVTTELPGQALFSISFSFREGTKRTAVRVRPSASPSPGSSVRGHLRVRVRPSVGIPESGFVRPYEITPEVRPVRPPVRWPVRSETSEICHTPANPRG